MTIGAGLVWSCLFEQPARRESKVVSSAARYLHPRLCDIRIESIKRRFMVAGM